MMNKILITLFFSLLLSTTFHSALFSQDIERTRPDEWDGLVEGARFMDRFLPMPAVGELSSANWGADAVKPRYTDNGIEDNTWSYWGGNIIQDKDGKYHQYLCRWREDAPKGHMQWPHSHVVHAISDNKLGPFKVVDSIGKGHNPEIQQLKDGRYFLYVNGGYYLSHSLDGPWQYNKFTYDQRQRPIFDHLANFTFAKREDGSFLMVCRGGGIWLSPDGLPPYFQISEKSVYPPYDGRYEDPVVWRTNIQYHMIVNDWLGRIAYYLRSKDGITWKLDAGEAYEPGIARHKNGHIENWYKFERIKMLQDEYGRAIQANFAVADTIKKQDLGSDKYSSKNLGIPLTIGRLISILNTDKIDSQTETIEVLVKAEDGFNPHRDMNIKSLRFGASEAVNFGKGCKVIKTEKQGDDLVLIFDAEDHGFSDENFVAKLLGKTRKGKLLFGYARLPWLNYQQQALSAKYPTLALNGKKLKVDVEIQNFGQVNSVSSDVKIEYNKNGQWHKLVTGKVPVLKPFEKNTLSLNTTKFAQSGEPALVRITLLQPEQKPIILEGKVIIR